MESGNDRQDVSPQGNQPSEPKDPLSPEVEEYMRMAARMLYDIIQEWRERHIGTGVDGSVKAINPKH